MAYGPVHGPLTRASLRARARARQVRRVLPGIKALDADHDSRSVSRGTLGQYLATVYLPQASPRWSPTWRKSVLVLVAQLTAELGGVPLALLSRKTVRTWWALHEGKVSRGEWRPATANQRLGLLRHVYNVALANGDVDHNPTLGLRKARTDPSTLPTEHLTDAERDRVLEACATASLDLHVAALLALYYGARRNTVLVTKIQDIAWDRGVLTLHATKTRARREHPIHPRVDAPLRALCAAREGAEALVRYTPAGLTHAWARVVRRLGLGRRFRFHGLRHDFGTRLFAGTKDLRLTQEALGHARVAQTERYTHVAAGAVNGALLGLR